jgi:hypothetical protein
MATARPVFPVAPTTAIIVSFPPDAALLSV